MSDLKGAEFAVKVLIIGDSGVGKSCLMRRYTTEIFSHSHMPTIGFDMKVKRITVGDMSLKMQIWDTSGQEKFKAITASYYKGSHGIILVFSYDSRESFEHINEWIQEADLNSSLETNKVLVANKADLNPNQREVTTEEAKKFAAVNGLQFYETSAKDNLGISDAFDCLGRMIKNDILTKPEKVKPAESNLLKEPSEKGGKRCCY